jgi:hypothetical protein
MQHLFAPLKLVSDLNSSSTLCKHVLISSPAKESRPGHSFWTAIDDKLLICSFSPWAILLWGYSALALSLVMPNEAPEDLEGAPFPFRPSEVTSLEIRGGIWNNVEGNSINLHNCKVFLTSEGQILRSLPLASTQAHPGGSGKRGNSSLRGGSAWTNPSRTRELCLPPTASRPPLPIPFLSAEFPIAMGKLEDISQLIAPDTDAIGIFRRVQPHLRELETLVRFASTAYTACGSGTVLGNTIASALDTQMKQCNIALSQILLQVAQSPYRFFPRIGYAYCVVAEWWTANELDEIRMIRLGALREVQAMCELLRCLYS